MLPTGTSIFLLIRLLHVHWYVGFLYNENPKATYFDTCFAAALCFEYDSQPKVHFIGTTKAGINIKHLLEYLYCPV